MSEINLTPQELIKRFAEVQQISEDTAAEQIGGKTAEEILENIKNYTAKQIDAKFVFNRKQKRKLKKNKKLRAKQEAIMDTTKKLTYIKLIEGLRKLNEKRENEDYENANEDD